MGMESTYKRGCRLPDNNSFFLFGARGTGKTTLLRQTPACSGNKPTRWMKVPGWLSTKCRNCPQSLDLPTVPLYLP